MYVFALKLRLLHKWSNVYKQFDCVENVRMCLCSAPRLELLYREQGKQVVHADECSWLSQLMQCSVIVTCCVYAWVAMLKCLHYCQYNDLFNSEYRQPVWYLACADMLTWWSYQSEVVFWLPLPPTPLPPMASLSNPSSQQHFWTLL